MNSFKKRIISSILVVAIVGISGFAIVKLNDKPIDIAFVGELSTAASQLSIESRDAVMYAVKEINASGGLLGKQVRVTTYDDKIDNDYKETLKSLLDQDQQRLIVGFNVSSMKPTIDFLMDNGDYLIVSPTVSTEALTGIDDRFVKVTVGSRSQIEGFKQGFALEKVKNIGIVYNVPNAAYSKSVAEMLVDELKNSETQVAFMYGDSGAFDAEAIEALIVEHKIDGLVAIMNGADSAKMSQLIAQKGYSFKIFGTSWGATSDFLINSGKTGNNTYLMEVKRGEYDPALLKHFSDWYIENTGNEPTFPAYRAYNSCQVLFKAIEHAKSTDPEKVKSAIIELKRFKGVDTTLEIDENGDAVGSYVLIKVVDGKFEKVEE